MKQDKIIDQLDKMIMQFYEKLSNWEETVAEQVGLTPRQCHAVSELGFAGKIRMKLLSERLGVTTGTMTIMADRLQKRNLIQRVEDAKDRRAFNIGLTEKGRAIYHSHMQHHRQLGNELFSSLSPKEVMTFLSLLEKIMQGI